MRGRGLVAPVLIAAALSVAAPWDAGAQVLVPWAVRGTVDTDGDAIPDLIDNAPGVANNQSDLDGDQIGDVIDPTPTTSNPVFPPFAVGIPPTAPVNAGSNAVIDYLVIFGSALGGYGHIDLDLGGNGIFDATYFGPLTTSLGQITVPPSLFSDPTWNLNAPGNYTFHLLGFAPGFNPIGSNTVGVSISTVQVVPEPGAAVLALGWGVAWGGRRARRPLRGALRAG